MRSRTACSCVEQRAKGANMKEYRLVYLNKGLSWSREKDLEKSQDVLNEYVEQGWELQQIVSPNDVSGALVGVFFREKRDGIL